MHVRRRMLAAAALLSITPGSVEELVAVYEQGSVIVYSETRTMKLAVEDATVKMGDFELPPEANESLKKDTDRTDKQTLESRTELLGVRDGVPTKARRTFDVIHREQSSRKGDSEQKGVLKGRSVLLERDAEQVTGQVDGVGEEVDESFLIGHELVHDVDALLPSKSVDVGASWSLERAAMEGFVNLDSSVRYFEEESDRDKFYALLMDKARFEGEAKFEAIEDHDGLRCARLTVSIDLTSEIDDPALFVYDMKGSREIEVDVSGSASLELETTSTLWFALEERRPVELKSELSGEMLLDIALTRDSFESTMDLTLDLSGSRQAAWTTAD